MSIARAKSSYEQLNTFSHTFSRPCFDVTYIYNPFLNIFWGFFCTIYKPGNVVYFLNTPPPTFQPLLMESCRLCWWCCWLRHSLFVYNCCWPGWSVLCCTSDTFCAWCKFSETYVALHTSLIPTLKQVPVTHKVKFVVSYLIWYSTYERIYWSSFLNKPNTKRVFRDNRPIKKISDTQKKTKAHSPCLPSQF